MTSRYIAIGEVLAGRFRIDRELGAGGMGVVYAAWHLELDHPVAIKVVTAPLGDLEVVATRFRREVRAAAKIRSEHVARVLDFGTLETGLPYMVLELLTGNDLDHELVLRASLPVSEAVEYILQAIEAIAEAHAAGIVHRDLKPANLFLAERADKTRIIKVLDFGISKSLLGDSAPSQVSLTQTGMMMGSPLYMSPEQMQSARDADVRSDIWALGVVLYQLLSGRTPFLGSTILELFASIFNGFPPPLTSICDSVPAGLERVVQKCLACKREDRFQNVGELAIALMEFAPQHAHVHCERAVRVLNPTGTFPSANSNIRSSNSGLSGSSSNPEKPNANAQSSNLLFKSVTPVSHPALPFGSMPVIPETRVAWNSKTQGERRERTRKGFIWGGVGATVILLLGVAAWSSFFRTNDGTQSERGLTTSVAQETTPLSVVTTASSQNHELSAVTSVIEPTVQLAPPVVAPNTTAASSISVPVNTSSVGRSHNYGKKPVMASPVTTNTSPINGTRASENSNLPDYGGRR
jgi:serine/threonine-protein kinase